MIVRGHVVLRPTSRSVNVIYDAAEIVRKGLPKPSWWQEFVNIFIPFGMAAASDFLENELLDHVLADLAYTAPTTNHSALYTSATDDTGGGTEVTDGNGYSRTANTFGTAASAGSISNSAATTFPTASGGNWGTISHAAITDSSTHGGGNFLFHGALTSSKAVNDGDTFEFATGDLTVSLA